MKRLFITVAFAALFLIPAPASAQTQDPKTAQDELISLVGDALVQEATDASQEVRKAKEVLDKVRNKGTTQEKEKAAKRVEDAERNYADVQKKIETARVGAFAEQCGKSPAEIQAMRDSGMGWGKIAKECGINPSTVGKGKGKDKSKKMKKDKMKGEDDLDDDQDEDGEMPMKKGKDKKKK